MEHKTGRGAVSSVWLHETGGFLGVEHEYIVRNDIPELIFIGHEKVTKVQVADGDRQNILKVADDLYGFYTRQVFEDSIREPRRIIIDYERELSIPCDAQFHKISILGKKGHISIEGIHTGLFDDELAEVVPDDIFLLINLVGKYDPYLNPLLKKKVGSANVALQSLRDGVRFDRVASVERRRKNVAEYMARVREHVTTQTRDNLFFE